MIEPGKRYVGPSGIELIVIKGGSGTLTDNQIPFELKGKELTDHNNYSSESKPLLGLGRRFISEDESISVLITKSGECDLMYNSKPLKLQQPRKLPSSD